MLTLLMQRCGAGEASSSFEVSEPAEPAELKAFCGLDLGGVQAVEAMVVDCSCCSIHAVGEYAAQVGLLFGSQRVLANAHIDGKIDPAGKVPLWSLGSHVPEVVCNKDKPMCRCAAKDATWAEFEPTCKTGPACRREPRPTEWPTICAEGAACPDRDKALGRDHVKGHNEDAAGTSGQAKTDDDKCTSLPPWYTEKEHPKFATRVSLGSSRCEDASPEQCHLFYAKVGGSWNHCELTSTHVKQCAATAVTEASAQANTAQLEAWATKHAYAPGAWPVKVAEDGTTEPVKPVTREEFVKHMQNLPRRVDKSYNF